MTDWVSSYAIHVGKYAESHNKTKLFDDINEKHQKRIAVAQERIEIDHQDYLQVKALILQKHRDALLHETEKHVEEIQRLELEVKKMKQDISVRKAEIMKLGKSRQVLVDKEINAELEIRRQSIEKIRKSIRTEFDSDLKRAFGDV